VRETSLKTVKAQVKEIGGMGEIHWHGHRAEMHMGNVMFAKHRE